MNYDTLPNILKQGVSLIKHCGGGDGLTMGNHIIFSIGLATLISKEFDQLLL